MKKSLAVLATTALLALAPVATANATTSHGTSAGHVVHTFPTKAKFVNPFKGHGKAVSTTVHRQFVNPFKGQGKVVTTTVKSF